jgi:hypothetical protein
MIQVEFGDEQAVAERREALSPYVGEKVSVKTKRQRIRVEGTLASIAHGTLTLTTAGGMPMQRQLAAVTDVRVYVGGSWAVKDGHNAGARTKTVLIRVTEDEKKALARHAARKGVSLSELLRDCALADAGVE